ncbi:MAG: cyclic peptide export ABC transporter [Cyanomargarita calcarea GSE-NOS-MK-12-04C]|uniref:Cyclic peptide export ABC transporter n=1 Tax=Cyanomargarita calcarea GSE-NOS-MK-12-04C TaxID=2839659 RepID=A0A951UT75_9CYAN|nr:cyclic peptide export ABC transporter [Cyanomargarita calcarea GSE-NOS-MK-12-04C]
MNLFIFILRSSWKMVAIAIIAGSLSGGSSAALIALISNQVSQNPNSWFISVIWGFAGLALVAATTNFISQAVLIRLSQNAIFQMRMRLASQIMASELNHLEQLGTPRLLATLTDDVQSVTSAVQVLPFLCIDLAIVLGCLTYLCLLYSSVFMLLLAFMVVAFASCLLIFNKGKKLLVVVREEQDLLFKHFRTVTEGIKELKLNYNRREDFINNELQTTANNYRRNNIRSLTLFAITSSWGQFVLFFAIGLVLFALPSLLNVSAQTLAGYILTFTYLMLPMDNLVNNIPQITRASVALQKIETLGLSLSEYTESITTPPAPKYTWQSLEFKGVTHRYRGEQEESDFILGPINLTIHPGELIFIVGGNGSGKSTLAKLIVGLYIPEDGEILLDKEIIKQENREWYRQYFSAIFADFYLFDRFLGLTNPNLDTQAQAYLKELQLDRKVKIENGKLSTTALSQGQRKRLSLLTAYLEDRPIYLFDEWAADQDPVFKELFYTKLIQELRNKGKTVLVISHDDRYFSLADRIVKLDYGKIEYDSSQT